jgi:AraC-like DNA-binding protein
MLEMTVAAGFARGLIDLAVEKGAPRAALAEQAGINSVDLEDQDNRIPFERYVTLMRAAKALSGDPALALHFGEGIDIRELSIVGLLSEGCTTTMEAFAQINRYSALTVDVNLGGTERLGLEQREGKLWIVDRRPHPNSFPELTESAFARFASAARRFGLAVPTTEVHLTYKAPSYLAEYHRIFGAPVLFECDWNAIQIDPEILTLKISTQPRYLFGILCDRADALLLELQRSHTTRGHVESLLMPMLHTGEASIDAIAAKLGVSRQTLYRKLKAEHTTFETVLDALRHQLALGYLSGGRVSVNETAYLLGFSDRAALSRAFKRWTGFAPGGLVTSRRRVD